nr:MAG TPA: helix-turn-helix domain protein [Caudoviricetes sp.]
MSFSAIRWALSQDSLEDPREALLLVVLADYHNDKTGQCNPSREALMKKSKIGNSNTLTTKLMSLQKKGLIQIFSKVGKSNQYGLNITTFNTEVPSEVKHLQNLSTFNTEAPPTSELKHLPTSELKHEPINEPIKEPINNSIESTPDFSLTAPEKTTISKTETVEKKPKRPKKEKVPCPYNEDDPIPEEFLKVAQRHNIQDPQQLFSKMVAYCKANGKQYADYKAAFTTWCLNESKWQQQKPPNQTSKPFAYEPPGGFTDEFYMQGCKFDKDGNLIL